MRIKMKRILFLIITALFITSCSLPEDETTTVDLVPVNTVEMPTAFAKDSITEIPVTYTRPTSCHVFSDFYYYINGNERTVAVYCAKLNQDICTTDVPYPTTVPLRFKPAYLGTYHFKFFTGTDDAGLDQFIEYDAVVNH
jgi:hypothetical protein